MTMTGRQTRRINRFLLDVLASMSAATMRPYEGEQQRKRSREKRKF